MACHGGVSNKLDSMINNAMINPDIRFVFLMICTILAVEVCSARVDALAVDSKYLGVVPAEVSHTDLDQLVEVFFEVERLKHLCKPGLLLESLLHQSDEFDCRMLGIAIRTIRHAVKTRNGYPHSPGMKVGTVEPSVETSVGVPNARAFGPKYVIHHPLGVVILACSGTLIADKEADHGLYI